MNKTEKNKAQIIKAAKKFFASHLAINPKWLSAGLHSDSIVLVLNDAISRGEKACLDEKSACEKMEKYYCDVFEQSKLILESAINNLCDRHVGNSFITVHIQSGCFLVVLPFIS